jgi:hypothetical protein
MPLYRVTIAQHLEGDVLVEAPDIDTANDIAEYAYERDSVCEVLVGHDITETVEVDTPLRPWQQPWTVADLP